MPTYIFRNKTTNETETLIMSLSQREEFLQSNPDMIQVPSAPAIGDSVRLGIRRIDDNFNDVLKKAKGAHLGSNINTR